MAAVFKLFGVQVSDRVALFTWLSAVGEVKLVCNQVDCKMSVPERVQCLCFIHVYLLCVGLVLLFGFVTRWARWW